jgi:hypothetical protein
VTISTQNKSCGYQGWQSAHKTRAVVIKGDNQHTKQELWLSRVTIRTQHKSCGYQGWQSGHKTRAVVIKGDNLDTKLMLIDVKLGVSLSYLHQFDNVPE